MPVFKYIKGDPDNIVADTLSRLPFLEKEKGYPPTIETSDGDTAPAALLAEDLFINYPADLQNFPLEFGNIRQHQQQQPDIANNNNYNDMMFYGTNLKVVTRRGKTKIVLPTSLINNSMKWYHHVLGHAGQERLYKSISQHMYCPGLTTHVANYVRRCPSCQRYKNSGRGIGHLAPTLSSLGIPWEEIAIDSIGPWKIVLPPPHHIVTFNGFTIIDTTTNILEIARATQRNATGEEACDALDNMWLTRYPKPVRCIFDQGKTFLNADFGGHLVNLGIKPVSCTVANPQANAILERSHDTIKSAMRTELHENPPLTLQTAEQLIDNVFASASYAVRCTVHKTIGVSPGSLAFNRDMLLPIPIISDMQRIRTRRQLLTDNAAIAENNRRRFHDYHVGDQMTIKVTDPGPLDERNGAVLTITNVHTNGTVSYLKNINTVSRINIRRIIPHY